MRISVRSSLPMPPECHKPVALPRQSMLQAFRVSLFAHPRHLPRAGDRPLEHPTSDQDHKQRHGCTHYLLRMTVREKSRRKNTSGDDKNRAATHKRTNERTNNKKFDRSIGWACLAQTNTLALTVKRHACTRTARGANTTISHRCVRSHVTRLTTRPQQALGLLKRPSPLKRHLG